MPDMLVKLYTLPPLKPELERQQNLDIVIRRALVPEKHLVLDWVEKHFTSYWRSETDVCFSRQPVSCFIATHHDAMIGFGCYDAMLRGFFGPTGVSEAARGKGSGKALLLACLHAMWEVGYGYAIIGGVGPADFYTKAVGAQLIEDSTPGVYQGLLRKR